MKTSDIYRRAFSLLRKKEPYTANRYNLKKAILDLGPTGYPFERVIAEILKSEGFSVEIGKNVQGRCISHEVDVIAERNKHNIMVECKFHNKAGYKTDVKVALYVQARFEDINNRLARQRNQSEKYYETWLVTNTKLTLDAIRYASCVGIKTIGWNHPQENSLQALIEGFGLHPVTSLITLTTSQKKQLVRQGTVLCKEIISNEKILHSIGLNELKVTQVLEEIYELCQQ